MHDSACCQRGRPTGRHPRLSETEQHVQHLPLLRSVRPRPCSTASTREEMWRLYSSVPRMVLIPAAANFVPCSSSSTVLATSSPCSCLLLFLCSCLGDLATSTGPCSGPCLCQTLLAATAVWLPSKATKRKARNKLPRTFKLLHPHIFMYACM